MAYDKLVDSVQLESDLTLIADSIRSKTGKSNILAFPEEFISEIEAIDGGGGTPVEPLDPKEVYRTTRPAEWPYIPLPSSMENPESADYIGEKSVIYLLYEKLSTDIFITDTILLQGTNITASLQKYLDAEHAIGSEVSIELTTENDSKILHFEYTESDTDWNSYNYIVLKIEADSLTKFDYYTRGKYVNSYPLNSNCSTALVEVSGSAENILKFCFGKTNHKYLCNLKYFSFGKTSVTSMTDMFNNCYSLQTIPELNTSKVTSMNGMFNICYSLQTIPLLDTSSVTDMSKMFNNCYSLQTIPLLDTSSVTNMSNMFNICYSLQTIPELNTSKVTNMNGMFSVCYSLQTIPLLDTSSVTDMSTMFNVCYSLQTIPELNTSKVTSMNGMFNICHSLQTIPLLDTSSVTDMSKMFNNCYSLQTIPELNTSKVTNMNGMFNNCSSLQSIPELNTSKVTNMNGMFSVCYSLQTIPLLDTSSVTDMSYINSAFSGCNLLRDITLSKWNFSSANGSSIFNSCYILKKIVIKEFGNRSVIYANPFTSCYHITGTTNAQYNPEGLKDGYIYVPDDMVETLKTATNWSTYASQIKGLSELPAA